MSEMLRRLGRGFGFGLVGTLGLYLAGASATMILLFCVVIASLFLLNAATELASVATVIALLWGALTYAGAVPSPEQAFSYVQQRIPAPMSPVRPKDGSQIAHPTNEPLAEKLEQIRAACERNLLTSTECQEARAKVIAEFGK